MGLPRKAHTGIFDTISVAVWDIDTKAIIFTGNTLECSAFLGVLPAIIHKALGRKGRVKKKYAIRAAKLPSSNDKQ